MHKLWQFGDDTKKQCITRNELQEDVFKAKGFTLIGNVDKNGKLIVEKTEKIESNKTK